MSFWRNNDVIIALHVHCVTKWNYDTDSEELMIMSTESLNDPPKESTFPFLATRIKTQPQTKFLLDVCTDIGLTTNPCWFDWALEWRHNEHDGVSNHQPHECLLNHLFRCRSNKTSKLRVTGLCAGNSPPVTGEFPAQRASNAEDVSIWWRHNGIPVPVSGSSQDRVESRRDCDWDQLFQYPKSGQDSMPRGLFLVLPDCSGI